MNGMPSCWLELSVLMCSVLIQRSKIVYCAKIMKIVCGSEPLYFYKMNGVLVSLCINTIFGMII
jgi:hypothetical protein